MKTDYGRAEAARRQDVLIAFIEAFDRECGTASPLTAALLQTYCEENAARKESACK